MIFKSVFSMSGGLGHGALAGLALQPPLAELAASYGAAFALRGFGPKTTAHVLRALATDRSKKERVPLAIARRDAAVDTPELA